jgi:flagellar protein FlgJ
MNSGAMLSGYTDFAGLHELKARASQEQSHESLEAAAKQFESMFIQLMMKSMRDANATMKSGLLDNAGTDMFEEMLDKEFSVRFGERGSLGLAEMLVKQLGQLQPVQPTDPTVTDTDKPLNLDSPKTLQPLMGAQAAQIPLSEQVIRFRSLGMGGLGDE